MGCHFFLQGIFLTEGSNLGLLLCQLIAYHLSHQGSPKYSAELWFIKWDLSQIAQNRILAHQLTFFVTLTKLLNLSELHIHTSTVK